MPGGRVLVTGATGFVGQRLVPALASAGYTPLCASRDPRAARERWPERLWTELDVHDPSTLGVLSGCRIAYYLVHSIGEGSDYAQRERRAAEAFARAAREAGVERIVYLGGVRPPSGTSRHLRARLEVGQALRSGGVSVVELRAGMLVGEGSASWTIVSQLAAKLPAMLLPSWLDRHSWPLGVDDAVAALVAAAELPERQDGCYALTGPERVSHRELLARTAAASGKHPLMLRVPFVTPRLSSYWITAVTGVRFALVRELVAGIQFELDPSTPAFWPLISHRPAPLDAAIQRALSAGSERPAA